MYQAASHDLLWPIAIQEALHWPDALSHNSLLWPEPGSIACHNSDGIFKAQDLLQSCALASNTFK